mmetsp:Transcript_3631/g.10535  ORF Transcript_3631/g.10535 Transcript_3631/m.10535 type:complete len:239 (-) Transcript_3631:168-884(-)
MVRLLTERRLSAALGFPVSSDTDASIGLLYFGGGCAVVDPETVPLVLLGHKCADLLVETTQHTVAADEDVHLGSQVVEDARKLEGDVASAHNYQFLGHLLDLENLVGCHGMLRAFDRWLHGPTTHRYQNVFGRVLLAVNIHGVLVDQLAPALDVGHPRIVQHAVVHAIQPPQLILLLGHELGPIDVRLLGGVPPKAPALTEFLGERGGVYHEFLGHAATQHARAASAADSITAHKPEG